MTAFPSEAALAEGLKTIQDSPKENGRLEMIVARPQEDARTILKECRLTASAGVEGDGWRVRCKRKMADGSPNPDTQIAIMNSRCIALLAGERSRWPLAGDQLFVDLDLSGANLPPGQKLAIGSAVLEITDPPHTGCSKFAARYGTEAVKFVNSGIGKQLHLRGIYARVIREGMIAAGDAVTKVELR